MGKQLYDRVRGIIESARAGVARSVDTAQVVSNWLIGREIVEDEQKGEKRAAYGRRVLERLSQRLLAEYGEGYSIQNLRRFREFFIYFPELIDAGGIRSPLVSELGARSNAVSPIHQVGYIGFHEAGYVGRCVFAHHHVIGDEFPHAIHLDDFVARIQ